MKTATPLLDIGTKVRHIKHPQLVGVIRNIVRAAEGGRSVLPYSVEWRDWSLAIKWFGYKFTDRAGADEVEEIK